MHAPSAAFLLAWLLLAAAQLGWLPFVRHAWALNLWGYLPPAAALGLALGSLALCSAPARHAAARAAQRLAARAERLPRAGVIVPLILAGLLWLLRERQLVGDSQILIWEASRGALFVFPDVGASFLLGGLLRLGEALPWLGRIGAVQLAVCACGAAALVFVWRAAAHLAPGAPRAAAALLLCGGLPRIFAGHVEVYAFLLTAVSAYLWSSLALLRGAPGERLTHSTPALLLGLAIWLHPSALALVPSLLGLALGRADGAPRWQRVRAAGHALVLAALPGVTFFALLFLAGYDEDLARAAGVLREITGTSPDPDALRRWVRGWGGPPSQGTDYVFLSLPHLKYLANALYLLSPPALPLLARALLRRPRALWATPTARFLACACLPLLAYGLVLRPVWGPFDWDLFTVTAFFLAALLVHGLWQEPCDPASSARALDLGSWLVGTSLLLVAIPFLWIGVGPARDAGPFAGDDFSFELVDPDTRDVGPLAPWL